MASGRCLELADHAFALRLKRRRRSVRPGHHQRKAMMDARIGRGTHHRICYQERGATSGGVLPQCGSRTF